MNTMSKMVSAALCTMVLATMAAEASPIGKAFLGTWKLDVAKSTFEGIPALQRQTRVYEDWGGGLIRATFEGVDAQGKRTVTAYVARYDNKDYPRVALRSETVGTIALKKIDGRRSEFTYKEDGKVSITGTRTISADGKTSTVQYTGTNAQGQPIRAVLIFDRQ
jgi:hypothetical protein